MNIENMKTLVGQLERLPDEKFWMADYIIHPEDYFYKEDIEPKFGNCGTVACIAGWACLSNGGPNTDWDSFGWAKGWLGLSIKEAQHLFRGTWSTKSMRNITRADAIAELNRLIAEAERVPA